MMKKVGYERLPVDARLNEEKYLRGSMYINKRKCYRSDKL